MDINEWLA